jgi:50S ribosomal subunit-associated GTPase HflX
MTWGECFAAMNLVLRPTLDESLIRQVANLSFTDTASSVRDRIPGELVPQEGTLQFITDVEALLNEGDFSREALISKMEAAVKEAISEGYEGTILTASVAKWS